MSKAAACVSLTIAATLLCSCARSHRLLTPSSLNARAPEEFNVDFLTSKGEFTIAVHRNWAPLGADRFYNLTRQHFYEGGMFFRVIPKFVVQFGINPAPAVSRAWQHAKLSDDPVIESNTRGRVAFATDGPNTRTTQIFISLSDNQRLDARGFSPFGEVTRGMAVVETFYAGYGEGAPRGPGPDQDRIEKEGSLYLRTEFPKLDYVVKTRIN